MAANNYQYSDTARALASQIEDDDLSPSPSRPSTSPTWHRRSLSRTSSERPQSAWRRGLANYNRISTKVIRIWNRLTPLQKIGIIVLDILLLVFVILALVFGERVFAALRPTAIKWRDMRGGWAILWAATFLVSFPPMIGYSTCVTVAGFVFGMKGWFIVSSATIVGSTVAFLASRTAFSGYVQRLTAQNKQFAALSLVLRHDGLKLLVMIRLCPLPYSLSNGAISTIPTVTWQRFMLATALVTPKLFLHVFVGSRMAELGDHRETMDGKTRLISYLSIAIGLTAGIATGYFIYTRTKARAAELEAEEEARLNAEGGRRTRSVGDEEFLDELEEQEALRRYDDDISLHQTYEGDLEGGRVGHFSDEFTDDDDDAHERDVFGIGDGDDDLDDDKESRKKGRQ